MRDQYAGDISDLLKFTFLRFLAADDRRLGIGWYYNPAYDGRPDGRHTEYLCESKWSVFDPVHKALRNLPERSVRALEHLGIWSKQPCFHREPVPSEETTRQLWASNMRVALAGTDLVFLDPDNGVGTTERHATVAEVASMRQPGRTVVVIKFPAQNKSHDMQIKEHHDTLRIGTSTVPLFTVCTRVSVLYERNSRRRVPSFRWFTVIDADKVLAERAQSYVDLLNQIDYARADLVPIG